MKIKVRDKGKMGHKIIAELDRIKIVLDNGEEFNIVDNSFMDGLEINKIQGYIEIHPKVSNVIIVK